MFQPPILKSFACYALGLMVTAITACANQPEAPLLRPLSAEAQTATDSRLNALLPFDVLLLGEQHDAAVHQAIEQQVVAVLAQRGLLAALVLEMADAGVSTAALKPSSTEQQVQNALKWNDKAWPWTAYGPAVMTAVRAEVPVLGGNLPRSRIQSAMTNLKLDGQLPGPALKAQQQLIRLGHCNLLPEGQITPMTRIQIAKDVSLATTIGQALLPGKAVLLLAGSGHVDRVLGVPQHLPASLTVKTVRLYAGTPEAVDAAAFDGLWATPALPETDYCEGLSQQLAPKP